ncbi:hypothetical protein [Fluviispira vulneris]|uniref:hypothetical protein n=1 Tax=Fluviispira vulneris TaxID=2763012 RepID=UPI0016450FB4|nr:hypothetical protein [Fluviispira vulneris]
MITVGDILDQIKHKVENGRFEVGFMGLGGTKTTLSNGKTKYLPNNISIIYNRYLKALTNDQILNIEKITQIQSILFDAIHKNSSFSRKKSTLDYYKYLLHLVTFLITYSAKNSTQSVIKNYQFDSPLNMDINLLLKFAENELMRFNSLTHKTRSLLLKTSKKFNTHETLLEDAQSRVFNFAIPERLTVNDIINFKRSIYYRFVIDESGAIIFGHDNNYTTPDTNTWNKDGFEIFAYNGIKVSSHAALNNYQPVISAGKAYFDIRLKKFTKINNYSGHYRPDKNSTLLAKILFLNYFPENCSNNIKIDVAM